jgi:NAD(P)-dependent dehydrogenase (short-subunit alcohol dehydrogenase family)
VQYPPREACHRCLSVDLEWVRQSGTGRLMTETTLHHSHERYFQRRLPWRLGLVRLDVGPMLVAHVHQAVPTAPASVEVTVRLDASGQAVLIARPPGEEAIMNDDPRIREMSCDPRGLNVLITDGTGAVGEALIQNFLDAGASRLWVGEPPGIQLPRSAWREKVSVLSLDVRNDQSVRSAAAIVGSQLDMLVNNSRFQGDEISATAAREEMEVNYFGLLRLSDHFAPLLEGRARGAWVNLLAICALSNLPAQSTFSASMAAALSFSQGLRARLRAAGLRLVNVFSGPIAPDSLSGSVIAALRSGVEDAYAGGLAQEWLARWQDNPKILEREAAG